MSIPYRTRRTLQAVGIVAAILVILLVIAGLVWVLWAGRFVVYDRETGARFDFSLSSQELTGVKATQPTLEKEFPITLGTVEKETTISTELVQLAGYYADVRTLEREFDLVLQQAAYIQENTPVMLDVKDVYGNFLYSTNVSAHRSSKVDTQRMDDLINYLDGKGAYLIARLPAFKDRHFGNENVPYGLHHSSNLYLWADTDGGFWLDPTKQGTMNHLKEIVLELKKMGFDEVVFDYFAYPDTDKLAFKGNREEAITKAAAQLVEDCATESFAISFVGTETDFPLPEGRSRLYLANRSASDAATLAAETGLEDIQIKLVFIADGNDTRFNNYGALRPLTAARLDELAEEE